jgi:transcriptional regulator with XRE-family HTH domain
MSTKRVIQKKFGIADLEQKHGPMSLGMFVRAFREADGLSQVSFAARLGISRANLCDIEKDRKPVSPERAARIAKKLGIPETVLIQLALQDSLRAARFNYRVELKAS